MANEKSWNELLKDWINTNYSGVTDFLRKFEEEAKIRLPRTTLSDYMNGDVKYIKRKEVVDKLYEITKIDQIKEAYIEHKTVRNKPSEKLDKTNKIKKLLSNVRELTNLVSVKYLGEIGYEPNIEERAQIFANLVNTTVDQVVVLSQYYRDNPKGVGDLTKIVTKDLRKEDVGYLISALNAMFDDDKFKSWVLMADYKPRRRK